MANKKIYLAVLCSLFLILLIGFASAGFTDFIKNIFSKGSITGNPIYDTDGSDGSGLVLRYSYENLYYYRVQDLSIWGNDGAYIGGIALSSSGIDGESLYLNNGYVFTSSNGTNSSRLNLSGEFTVSTWVYLNSLPPFGKYPNIVGKFTDYTGYGIYYDGNYGGIFGMIGRNGGWYRTNKYAINPGQWHHVLVTLSSGVFTIYVDGVSLGSVTGTPPAYSNNAPVVIGRHYSSANYGFIDGMVDETMIFNRSISRTEVQELYTNQLSRLSTNGTNPNPVNGVCGSTLNSCTSGTFNDLTDTTNYYMWQCVGMNGGYYSNCNMTKGGNSTFNYTLYPYLAYVNKGFSNSAKVVVLKTSEPAEAVSVAVSGLPFGVTVDSTPKSCTPTLESCFVTFTYFASANAIQGTSSIILNSFSASTSNRLTVASFTVGNGTAFNMLSTNVVGMGKITGNGIDCGNGNTQCLSYYNNGTNATLTATPINGFSTFSGWNGSCSGTASNCTVFMNSSRGVSATFSPLNVTTCIDSDGGLDYFLKGSVFNLTENDKDTCCVYDPLNGFDCGGYGNATTSHVLEWFCDASSGNGMDADFYECPMGCNNGACIFNTSDYKLYTDKNEYFVGEPVQAYTILPEFMNCDQYLVYPNGVEEYYGSGGCFANGISFGRTFYSEVSNYRFKIVAKSVNNALLNITLYSNYFNVSHFDSCPQLIGSVESPSDFVNTYGLNFTNYRNYSYNGTWQFNYTEYNYTSYSAWWNNDEDGYFNLNRGVIVFEDADFDASLVLRELNNYDVCVERSFSDQIVYVCSYNPSDNLESKSLVVIWAKKNVLIMEHLYSGRYLAEEEILKIRSRKADNVILSLADNHFDSSYTAFDIHYHLSSIINADVSLCGSDLVAEQIPRSFNCKIEPSVCPEYGYQNQICIGYSDVGGEVVKEQRKYCSPGVCSGCYVQRWMGYDNGDNVCIPYGTRLVQSDDEEQVIIDEGYYPEGNDGEFYNLTIYDSNGAYLTIVDGSASFDGELRVGNTYYIYDGEGVLEQFRVDDIVPSNGNESGYMLITIFESFNAYCNYNGDISRQKYGEAACQNNYECESNLCSSGTCVPVQKIIAENTGFRTTMIKLVCRISSVFDFNETYQQCVDNALEA